MAKLNGSLYFGGGGNLLKKLCNKITSNLVSNRKNAFTLAEVLITIGIIGIVAAITIPMLITKYEKQVTITGLKRSYSTLVQAIKRAEYEEGEVAGWTDWDPNVIWYVRDGKAILEKYLMPALSGSTLYTNGMDEASSNMWGKIMCYTPGVTPVHSVHGSTSNQFQVVSTTGNGFGIHRNRNPYSLLLLDGSCIALNVQEGDGDKILARVYIDINGPKRPNIMGRDFFIYVITTDGQLLPLGYDASDEDIEKFCSNRVNVSGNNDYCAAKIMRDSWRISADYPWSLKNMRGTSR